MKPSFVVYVLLLSLILTKTQGIRLGKGSLTTFQLQKQQQGEENTLLKRSNNDADEEALVCKNEECTTAAGNIKNRKLVTTTSISTTPTISKNVVKNGKNEAHPIVNGNSRNVKVNNGAGDMKVKMSKAKDLQQEEHFPDLDDIVEMDYSPARRKSPIHN